jgi:hypothetical protein
MPTGGHRSQQHTSHEADVRVVQADLQGQHFLRDLLALADDCSRLELRECLVPLRLNRHL